MMKKSPFDILSSWINYCETRNLLQNRKDFWLLRDYIEGDVWSEKFYKKHKPHVIKILNNLDKDKKEVVIILNHFTGVLTKYES